MYIFLSGGKTMGHITPLICLNNELKNSYEIVYFGLKDSMEEEVCKRNNITFFQMELYPFYRKKIWKNIKTFYRIFVEKNRIKKQYKNCSVKALISSGGYASIPVNFATKNCKKILLEPNVSMGLANKFLSFFVDKICVQFPTIKSKKSIVTGSFVSILKSPFDHIFFYQNRPLILFVGGSNGALEIVKICHRFSMKYTDVNIILITGNNYYDTYTFPPNVYKVKSVENLNGIFKNFDLIVSRAGASTISEIIMTNTCSVIIPSPNVSANHQILNAEYLKKHNLALVLSEDEELVEEKIYLLLIDKERIKTIKDNLKSFMVNDAIKRVINLI